MQTNEKQLKFHTVPADVLLDVFSILFDNGIAFTIEGINEDENTVMLPCTCNPQLPNHKYAQENITEMIADYNHYRYKSDNSTPIYIPWNDPANI